LIGAAAPQAAEQTMEQGEAYDLWFRCHYDDNTAEVKQEEEAYDDGETEVKEEAYDDDETEVKQEAYDGDCETEVKQEQDEAYDDGETTEVKREDEAYDDEEAYDDGETEVKQDDEAYDDEEAYDDGETEVMEEAYDDGEVDAYDATHMVIGIWIIPNENVTRRSLEEFEIQELLIKRIAGRGTADQYHVDLRRQIMFFRMRTVKQVLRVFERCSGMPTLTQPHTLMCCVT
jgi:hypothetical protein